MMFCGGALLIFVGCHGLFLVASPAARCTTTTTTLRSTAAAASSSTTSTFQWSHHWYPVMPLSYANDKRPNAFELLGKRLVLWKSNETWSCVADACPHRLAPLSCGSVTKRGALTCRFHGWSFGADGACMEIPNAIDPVDPSLSCAEAFPVREVGGLLWVWPDSKSALAAAAASVALPPSPPTEWVMTTPPVSYESMLENSMDPSHAPFLHEFAKDRMIPMSSVSVGRDDATGFTIFHNGYREANEGMLATRNFVAPSLVDVTYKLPTGKIQHYPVFFTPSNPLETRVIAGLGALSLAKWLPRWCADFLHVLLFTRDALWKFNDQDRLVMMGQDVAQLAEGKTQAAHTGRTTPSDVGVEVFKRWIDRSGKPFAPGTSSSQLANFDETRSRWYVHGRHCPSCQRGLAFIDASRKLFGRLGLLAAAAAAVLVTVGRTYPAVYAIVAALAAYGTSRYADQLQAALFGKQKELWIPQVYRQPA
ncbi:hypothetical protein CTAYLR_007820 [Chrysophaeum taylorii]|uniref:Rieske domain-containing protein n=1 Tax=Chrysophaeum taylorii TaxID=2483200 RepID=A0AAD7UA94_9STRA|nr:hypothetical protein CTAYLR_007820 [Chrysophaeum taylorii]